MQEFLANLGLSPELFALAIDWAIRIIGVILILFIAFILAKVLQTKVRTRLEDSKVDKTIARLLGTLVRWLVLMLAFIGCLGIFGIQTTSFAAILGGGALAIGLAFQGTLSNVAAGAMLLVFRPYRVDDWVTLDGVSGTVYELGLFTTTLDTPSGSRYVVPNNKAFGTTIENVTILPTRRIDIAVGVGYDADIDQTRKVLVESVAKLDNIIGEPSAFLSGLGGSSVDWKVRAVCKNEHYWALYEQVIRAVKMGLDEADIEIPYPHIVVEGVGKEQ